MAAARARAALEGRAAGGREHGAGARVLLPAEGSRSGAGAVVRGDGALRDRARPRRVRVRRLRHAGRRLRRGLRIWASRRPSGSASRSGSIRGTTACPAATRSRTGCGRCPPASMWGTGPGLGSPQSIPAGHTDFVLAAIGEELGFVGVLAVVALYALLSWRCLRVAVRAPGDYTAFLAIGVALALVVQAFVIAGGLLGLVPLDRRRHAVLSFGRSSMLANCVAVGIVLAVGRRRGPVRPQLAAADRRARPRCSPACMVAVVGRAPRGCRSSGPIRSRPRSEPERAGAMAATASSTTHGSSRRPVPSSGARSTTGTAWCSRRAVRRRSRRSTATFGKAGVSPANGPVAPASRAATRLAVWRSACSATGHARPIGAPATRRSWSATATHAQGLRRSPAGRRRREPAHRRARADDQARLLGAAAARPAWRRLDAPEVAAAAGTAARLCARRSTRGCRCASRTPCATASSAARTRAAPRSCSTSRPARCSRRSAIPGRSLRDGGAPRHGGAGRAARSRALRPLSARIDLQAAGRGAALRTSAGTAGHHPPLRAPAGRTGRQLLQGLDTPGARRHRWTRRRTATSTCTTGSSSRATPTSRSWPCSSGPRPLLDAASLFQIDAARPSTAAALSGRWRTPATARPTCSCRRSKMARVVAAIAGGGAIRPVRWTPDADEVPEDAPAVPRRSRCAATGALHARGGDRRHRPHAGSAMRRRLPARPARRKSTGVPRTRGSSASPRTAVHGQSPSR